MRPVLRRDRPAQHAGDDAGRPALPLRGAAAGQSAADPGCRPTAAGRAGACSSSRKRPAPMRSLPGPAAISSPRSARSRWWASGWSRATSIPAIKIAWSGRGYGCVVGVADGGEYGLLSALRSYQEHIRIHQPGRDEMILLNTWGDRGQDTRIRKSFALAELDAAARLGITHFQLDDGWQAGQSSNSAFAGGSLENIWTRSDYWTPHPERFPEWAGPGGRTEQGVGDRAVPVVQSQQGRQLRPLARRRRRADRPLSAVRHPHIQDRWRDDPRQARRSQPAQRCSSG